MSNQIVISSGAKVRNLDGVLTGTSGIVNSLGINVPDGIPQLDGSGKILVSQLPNSVMEYKGTWNAATNTPTLANGTGNAGDVYLCNVAGTVNFGAGPITFAVGDQVLYSGTTWEKASGATGTVTSVAVTESGDALTITGSPITTSGTINIGFAGTGAQYVKGDGTLATFPTTIDQAKRLITEVYNSTGSTLTKGTVVYINGGQGNLPTITKAIATGDSTSAQTYGVVQSDITNNNNGFVVVLGSLTDIDTQAYSVGTQLYLSGSTAGAWTSTKPSAPIHLVYVGIVVRSHPTQGVVEIRIQNGYELEELHDVAITSVANNDGIFYNSSNDLWENKTIDEALGYTPANDSLVVHLAGTETITGAKTFSNNATFQASAEFNYGVLLKDGSTSSKAGYFNIASLNSTTLAFLSSGGRAFDLILPTSGGQITVPNGSGTLALTSNLSSYVPYTGATTFVNLGTQLFYSGGVVVENAGNGLISTDGSLSAGKGIFLTNTVSGGQWSSGTTNLVARNSGFLITRSAGGGLLIFDSAVTYDYTFPSSNGTIALTSNLSSYLPLSGGTLTGALSGTSATFSTQLKVANPTGSALDMLVLETGFNNPSGNKSIIWKDATNTLGRISVSYDAGTGSTMRFGSLYNGGYQSSDLLTIGSNGAANFVGSISANSGEFINGGQDGSLGSVVRISTTNSNANARNWGIVNTWDNYGDLTFRVSNAQGGNALSAGSTKMVITSSGNVGIGTSNPTSKLAMVVASSGSNQSGLDITNNVDASFNVSLRTGITEITAGGSGNMVFSNSSERMRITSGGKVQINTTGTSKSTMLDIVNASSQASIACQVFGNGDNAVNFYNGSGTYVASIVVNSSSVAYNTSSDYRLKEDLKEINGLEKVSAIKVYDFKWKASNERTDGVLAHELEEVLPYAVSGEKDGEMMQGVDYSKIVPVLVKAIQELKAEIDELKNK